MADLLAKITWVRVCWIAIAEETTLFPLKKIQPDIACRTSKRVKSITMRNSRTTAKAEQILIPRPSEQFCSLFFPAFVLINAIAFCRSTNSSGCDNMIDAVHHAATLVGETRL
jgi:Na+-transporting methylmalonyl-CoA/oxaloacetate decarboxylase beta subunit